MLGKANLRVECWILRYDYQMIDSIQSESHRIELFVFRQLKGKVHLKLWFLAFGLWFLVFDL